MANGYSQIYGYSTFTVFNLWKYKYNPLIVACVVKKRKLIMGAIVVSAFVTIVAIVGVIYFNHQDKKKAQKAK